MTKTNFEKFEKREIAYNMAMIRILQLKEAETKTELALGAIQEFVDWDTARKARLAAEKKLKDMEEELTQLALEAENWDPDFSPDLGSVNTRQRLVYDADEAVKWLVEKGMLGMLKVGDEKGFTNVMQALGDSRPDWAVPESERYFAFARKALKERAEAEYQKILEGDIPQGAPDAYGGEA